MTRLRVRRQPPGLHLRPEGRHRRPTRRGGTKLPSVGDPSRQAAWPEPAGAGRASGEGRVLPL